MSAYVVSDIQIDAILTAAFNRTRNELTTLKWKDEQGREVTTGGERLDEVGAMLLRENEASVNFRYSHLDDYTEENASAGYSFRVVPDFSSNPARVLNAIACYEYQACEHPGWESSEAYRFCQALKEKYIDRIRATDDTWAVTDRSAYKLPGISVLEMRRAGR